MQFVKLVVVSANDLVRNGIQMLTQSAQSIEIAQACSTLFECEEYLKGHRANVLLLDDVLPGYLSPTQAVSELHDLQTSLQIIVLATT